MGLNDIHSLSHSKMELQIPRSFVPGKIIFKLEERALAGGC